VRRLAANALALVLLPMLAGCRPDTVAVSFRPAVGATYRYEVRVESETTTTLEGGTPQRKVSEVRLVAEHTVLEAGRKGVRVRVLVGEPGTTAQAFVVRFDRSAELVSIESAEGASDEFIGALGIPEIFPGAGGTPPDRRLGPGDEWSLVRPVRVPGADRPARLRTRGRLVELGLAGDEKVARLRSTAELPIQATTLSASGALALDGRQRIEQRATYDLDDGAVRGATATTTGHFRIEIAPPFGSTAPAVPGTLDVRVTSTTRRLG